MIVKFSNDLEAAEAFLLGCEILKGFSLKEAEIRVSPTAIEDMDMMPFTTFLCSILHLSNLMPPKDEEELLDITDRLIVDELHMERLRRKAANIVVDSPSSP